MLKSEYAREQVKKFLSVRGQVPINELVARAPYLTDDGDPRWIGAAVSHFDSTGELRHVTCDFNHSHTDDCKLEWVGA